VLNFDQHLQVPFSILILPWMSACDYGIWHVSEELEQGLKIPSTFRSQAEQKFDGKSWACI
jgi:hypothetical protein